MKQYRESGAPLDGADVIVGGLFPGNERQYEVRLDELAALAEARGGRVVGRFVQRRGASDRWHGRPGGAARMSLPFSRRTLLTPGKVREVADECRKAGVDAVVFVNPLTALQRTIWPAARGIRARTASCRRARPARRDLAAAGVQ